MATLTGKVALDPRWWLFIQETLISILSSIHPSIPAPSACVTVDPAGGSSAGEQPE